MKRTILFILFGILFHNGIYAQKKGNDTIYYELSLFLVHQKIISEQYLFEHKDDYASLIDICDLLEKYDHRKKPDLSKEFGIYFFSWIGLESGWIFLLIKNKNNYTVFRSFEISLIINELLKIRDEDPKLIDDVSFCKYLKKITDYDNTIGLTFLNKKGKIQFITKQP